MVPAGDSLGVTVAVGLMEELPDGWCDLIARNAPTPLLSSTRMMMVARIALALLVRLVGRSDTLLLLEGGAEGLLIVNMGVSVDNEGVARECQEDSGGVSGWMDIAESPLA